MLAKCRRSASRRPSFQLLVIVQRVIHDYFVHGLRVMYTHRDTRCDRNGNWELSLLVRPIIAVSGVIRGGDYTRLP